MDPRPWSRITPSRSSPATFKLNGRCRRDHSQCQNESDGAPPKHGYTVRKGLFAPTTAASTPAERPSLHSLHTPQHWSGDLTMQHTEYFAVAAACCLIVDQGS